MRKRKKDFDRAAAEIAADMEKEENAGYLDMPEPDRPELESRIKELISENQSRPKHDEIWVRRNTRIAVIAVIIAVLLVGCTVAGIYILPLFMETEQHIDFLYVSDIEGFTYCPPMPEGYKLSSVIEDNEAPELVFINEERHTMLYVEAISDLMLSVDNETESENVTLNGGYKALLQYKNGEYKIYWTNGKLYFFIAGVNDRDIILWMANNLYKIK